MGHNTAALIRFRHFINSSLALAFLNLACRDHVPAFPQRCRVGPVSLTPSRSQIRTLNSRVLRLVPPNEGCRLRSRIGAPPVASWLTPSVGDLPPSLHGHTPLPRYYGAVRPYPPHRHFPPRSFAACTFSLWHRRTPQALLHLSYSSVPLYADGTFVTHDPLRTQGDLSPIGQVLVSGCGAAPKASRPAPNKSLWNAVGTPAAFVQFRARLGKRGPGCCR
jgi:hypothetical protein